MKIQEGFHFPNVRIRSVAFIVLVFLQLLEVTFGKHVWAFLEHLLIARRRIIPCITEGFLQLKEISDTEKTD